MPVAAVMAGGTPTVSSGSAITATGMMRGWKISRLVCVASSVMTETRPTSEPVPAVVGTATVGAMPVEVGAPVQLSPTSSKSHKRPRLARQEGDGLAGIERAAAAERDHAVMAARAVDRDAVLDVRRRSDWA